MGLLDRIDGQKKLQTQKAESISEVEEAAAKAETEEIKEDPYLDVKRKIHSAIIDEMNKSGKVITDREQMYKIVDDRVNEDEFMIPRIDRVKVAIELFNDIMGYGPIEELVQNPNYSEIMVNGPDKIYVEDKGKLKLTDLKFRDEEHLMNIINRIVGSYGNRYAMCINRSYTRRCKIINKRS